MPILDDGRHRVSAGTLNGITPELGAILGPMWTREMLVVDVTGVDESGRPYARCSYATEFDLQNAAHTVDSPRTVAEFERMQRAQQPIVDHFRWLFGDPRKAAS
jgi:hypothetical protein